jgi:hypothetical protein
VLGLELGDADQQRLVPRHQLVDARREPADLPQRFQHTSSASESIFSDGMQALKKLAWKILTPAPYRRRGVSSYRFATLEQQKQGRTANTKIESNSIREGKNSVFPSSIC